MANTQLKTLSSPSIHPTALIETGAVIASSAQVGPFCVIGPNVVLGENVRLLSHVVIAGHTTIGANTIVYPFASIGHAPQDLKYKGEASRLEIGSNCQIREYVTINPGTDGGGLLTKIGNDCLLMVGAHVAHDCIVGNNCILVNNATLAGHVHLGDFAIIGGLSAVHQHVRIGAHAMIGGMSGVENDVIPYGTVMGERAHLSGLNIVGLKRRGFEREDIHTLRNAYRLLFAAEGTLQERLDDVAKMFEDNKPVRDIVDFIRVDSGRAICQPKIGQD